MRSTGHPIGDDLHGAAHGFALRSRRPDRADAATRAEARRLTRETAELAGSLGVNMICWPGIEGYNYPFQTGVRPGLGVVHRGDGRGGSDL